MIIPILQLDESRPKESIRCFAQLCKILSKSLVKMSKSDVTILPTYTCNPVTNALYFIKIRNLSFHHLKIIPSHWRSLQVNQFYLPISTSTETAYNSDRDNGWFPLISVTFKNLLLTLMNKWENHIDMLVQYLYIHIHTEIQRNGF